jgi:hypothetical protein
MIWWIYRSSVLLENPRGSIIIANWQPTEVAVSSLGLYLIFKRMRGY